MMKAILAILAISAAPAAAETITFQSDDEIMIVRGFQNAFDLAQFDILGPRDGTALCVAIGADGKPMATATTFVQIGYVAFDGLHADEIAKVACRYN